MSKIEISASKFEVENSMAEETSVYKKKDEVIIGVTWSSQILQDKLAKPAGVSDENWEELDLKATSTI